MSAVAKAALAIALLAGGSGEPAGGKKNFFIDDLADFRKGLVSRGWQVEVVAGAGGKASMKAATNAELQASARRVLLRAKTGDRVLLVFHSHGLKQRADWGQHSHSITSEDADGSGSEPGFDLDRLQPALLDAEKRGVKTALVDLSCYSGATLALRGTACTVALASKKYVSLCSGRPEERLFASHFMKLPPASTAVSLETKFLEARRADLDSINLPQISSIRTPALEAWDEFLEKVDPLDVYDDLKDLHKGYKTFEAGRLLGEIKEAPRGFSEQLRKTLSIREKLEEQIPALARDYDEADLAFEAPGGASLKLAPASLADLLEAAEGKEDEPEDWDDVQRHRLEQLRPVRKQLSEKFKARLGEFQKRRQEFDRLTRELETEADALFSKERQVYESNSQSVAEQNGCKEFQL